MSILISDFLKLIKELRVEFFLFLFILKSDSLSCF
jgi:hypothetical protein